MQVDVREVLSMDGSPRVRRTVLLSIALAVVVVLVAGIAGTANLTGPRWYPHGHSHHHTKLPASTSAKLPALVRHRPPQETTFPLTVVLAVLVIALLGIAAWLLLRWLTRKSLKDKTPLRSADLQNTTAVVKKPEPQPDPPVLLSGIALALQTLDEQRDPADAVVRAWLGLQETAEQSGIVRKPSETPTEFTTRILSQAFTDDRAVKTLLRLYLRTRFGDHPVTAEDVIEVRAALAELVDNWHAIPATGRVNAE